jgi:hypothetical protein
MEGAPEQTYRVEVLQPLAVGHIALAPRQVLGMAGVDQTDFQTPLFQNLEQRDPVDPSGFHS